MSGVVGVEYEYKWLLRDSGRSQAITAKTLIAGLAHLSVDRMPTKTFIETAMYLDTDSCRLERLGLSLAVNVNHSVPGKPAGITLKETVAFKGGRRDALEVFELHPLSSIAIALESGETLPLRRLQRLTGICPHDLGVFATVRQERAKTILDFGRGATLGLTIDYMTIHSLNERPVSLWVEIESDSRSYDTLKVLEEGAKTISRLLSVEPTSVTKPAYVAGMRRMSPPSRNA